MLCPVLVDAEDTLKYKSLQIHLTILLWTRCRSSSKGKRYSRDDIWITSKLWPSEYGEGKTAQAIDKMLSRLDTDYIDLLLLHQ